MEVKGQRNTSDDPRIGKVLDAPQTITIVPQEVIEDRGATSLRDVLRNVPGISMQAGEGGVPAGDQLSIRGFSARTDIFIDGVRDTGGYTRDPFILEQRRGAEGPGLGLCRPRLDRRRDQPGHQEAPEPGLRRRLRRRPARPATCAACST